MGDEVAKGERAGKVGKKKRLYYRTSIMRASREARRARSFSSAGGRTLSLREAFRRSAAWIAACGVLRGSCKEVKRLGGRAKRML